MSELETAFKRQPHLSRWLCHLYQRLNQCRLNLVVGAGTSIDAGVPSWDGLLDRLAKESPGSETDLQHHRDTGLSPEYLGQIIFLRHRNAFDEPAAAGMRDATIDYRWAELIHRAIYEKVPDDIDKVVENHPYLAELRDLARKLPLIINFNFDDILSDAIGRQVQAGLVSSGRPYTIVWEPPLVDRVDATIIYHVNGILPRVSLKKRSPQLIFTEDAFTDALARSPSISSEYIFLRFVQNTMLIIGHSLSDSSLKNYLRQNRDRCPANHHYMIRWLNAPDHMTDEQMHDVFEANLELYNLVTIFLTSDEIKEFIGLLNSEERMFRERLDQLPPERRSRFHYYIVGPVAGGKSTVLEQLRCFSTFEEWTRPPPKEMYLSTEQLKKVGIEASKRIDNFVYSETKEKNMRMHNAGIGFHFMDRAPLDLYAFSNDDHERQRKTEELRDVVTRDRSLHSGEIVFVTASGETLVRRNLGRGRDPETSGTAEYLNDQSEFLQKLYEPTYILDTDQQLAGEVAKKVARHALLEEYKPIDLNQIMNRYQ